MSDDSTAAFQVGSGGAAWVWSRMGGLNTRWSLGLACHCLWSERRAMRLNMTVKVAEVIVQDE